jgi:signal transduction histidine kinase
VTTIIVVFIAFFTAMFFAAGAYHSGMPSFSIFALIFTVVMLEGAEMFLAFSCEMTFYVGLCLYAYYRPESVSSFGSERGLVMDIITGFVASSLFLAISLLKILGAYRDASSELERKNAELELGDRRKTEFLSNMAHELKTPVAVIMGISQNVRRQMSESPKSDELMRDMKALSSEAGRIGLLIDQMLDAARIEEGRMTLDIRDASVEEIIQTTINSYYPLLKKNNNCLALELRDDLPRIRADSRGISQVLVNLLQNAIRHTSGGTIIISAEPEGEFVKISVADTGEGIEAERLPVIFERFKSRDSAKSRASNDTGSGLGLFICKHIVQSHGGAIELVSEAGAGTRVSFTIPACR